MYESTPPESYHVTAVIAHLVKPGRTEGYEDWLKGIIPVAKTFKGHLGVHILRPQKECYTEYVIILHFDCHEHLQVWLESDIRREWLDRVKPLIQKTEDVQVLTGLETWFVLPGRSQKAPPKRHKIALITWLGVYCSSLVVGFAIGPTIAPLPLLLRQAIVTGLIVFSLAYGIMPQLTRLFHRWLHPNSQA